MDSNYIVTATEKYLAGGGLVTKCPIGYAISKDYEKIPTEDEVLILKTNIERTTNERKK